MKRKKKVQTKSKKSVGQYFFQSKRKCSDDTRGVAKQLLKQYNNGMGGLEKFIRILGWVIFN